MVSENDIIRLIKQILEGVHYLHQNNIVHLDLKVMSCSFKYHYISVPSLLLLCATNCKLVLRGNNRSYLSRLCMCYVDLLLY